MTRRRLAITQRQVRAICEGAAKAGYGVVMEVDGVTVRLVPKEVLAPHPASGLDAPHPQPGEEEEFHL